VHTGADRNQHDSESGGHRPASRSAHRRRRGTVPVPLRNNRHYTNTRGKRNKACWREGKALPLDLAGGANGESETGSPSSGGFIWALGFKAKVSAFVFL
jgi:hypothetical protein